MLFANAQPRLTTYLPLASAITSEGHLCFLVVTNQTWPDDNDLRGYEHVEVCRMTPTQLANLEGIHVFISAEVCLSEGPPTARRVAIMHSLPDRRLKIDYSKQFIHKPYLRSEIDYFVIAVVQDAKSWNPNHYASSITAGQSDAPDNDIHSCRTKDITIVPGGYPKLDYLMAPNSEAAPRIIYCPTNPRLDYSSALFLGDEIIQTLLEAFPTFEVVFRPYPAVGRDEITCIADKYSKHPNFIYDTSLTGVQYFSSAAMAVTDASSAAVSFSIATCRPSLFLRPDLPDARKSFDPIGRYVRTCDELSREALKLYHNRHSWSEKIYSERDKYIYNVGAASQYIAKSINHFATGTAQDGWLTVPRTRS